MMELELGQPKLGDTTNILDIVIPPEMENAIPTGHPYIDKLFAGDGIIAGTVALVTGDPGAGKSTLMQDLADKLTGQGHIALYVTGEESVYQLRRVAKRLGLKNGFLVSHKIDAEEIIAHVSRLRESNKGKKVFLIIDSLPCLRISPPKDGEKRGRPMGAAKQSDLALQMITTYAKNNWVPVLMINHVTKSGAAAGKNTVKHVVDCHLHLSIDVDPVSGMEERTLEMSKNRFGPTGISFAASMSARGLEFRVADVEISGFEFEPDYNANNTIG